MFFEKVEHSDFLLYNNVFYTMLQNESSINGPLIMGQFSRKGFKFMAMLM